jgi:hypothetical protein
MTQAAMSHRWVKGSTTDRFKWFMVDIVATGQGFLRLLWPRFLSCPVTIPTGLPLIPWNTKHSLTCRRSLNTYFFSKSILIQEALWPLRRVSRNDAQFRKQSTGRGQTASKLIFIHYQQMARVVCTQHTHTYNLSIHNRILGKTASLQTALPSVGTSATSHSQGQL